ncbi:MAG TPA: ATP-binding cassette domain-containing protein [Segetibacter sp.]|jgi:molybdate transport system ATP-binding protein
MPVLEAKNISVNKNGKKVLDNISFSMEAGEQWAITGTSGSGKTTLLKVLTGEVFFTGTVTIGEGQTMVLVEQQHYFKNLSNTSNFYYQQRFNSRDAEDAITVAEELLSIINDDQDSKEELSALADLLDIKRLFNERLLQLSNGENKRLQIVKALLSQPEFLLLDNPFIGLDVKSRQTLEEILGKIAGKGVHIIMVTSANYLPAFITNVLSLSLNGSWSASKVNPVSWNQGYATPSASFLINQSLLQPLISQNNESFFEFAVRMINVNITYDHKILDNINWEVRRGERWSLSGPNGSGKSTLLSLVNADNPQAYANEIYLFDRKRGTGETIWEIKRKIGFVSPELHLYFEKGTSSFEVVASGLFDTIGLFRQINEEQSSLVEKWMQVLKIDHLKRKLLNQLSDSEQRLVLLARALVKNPPMLVLDEPCQGLDEEQTALFKAIVNEICVTGNKTLIYVSHYTDEIPECVTKFIKLENGKRVE